MEANVMSPADVWNAIVTNPLTSVTFILLVISEGLASIKSVEASSVFQLIVGFLKKVYPGKQ